VLCRCSTFIEDCIHQKRMALTPPSAEVCFICLDEGTAESSVELLTFELYRDIPCSCQVSCHMQCWTAYYVKKGGFECPICHCKVPSTSLNEQQVEQQQQPFYNSITTEKSLLVLALLCLICAIIILIIRLM
jgi:hypothetical protein